MDIPGKIEAIVEFSTDTVKIATELYDDFFQQNDLGIPLAIAVNANLATLNDEGVKIIEETFIELCKAMEIDVNKDYEDYDEMLDESIKNDEEDESSSGLIADGKHKMAKACPNGCTGNMECVKCQTVIYEWEDTDEEE